MAAASTDGLAGRIARRRFGQPGDVGERSVLLASDRSSFITGQHFVIDGGQTQRMVSDPPAVAA